MVFGLQKKASVALIIINVSPDVILIEILSGKQIVYDELEMLRQSCACFLALRSWQRSCWWLAEDQPCRPVAVRLVACTALRRPAAWHIYVSWGEENLPRELWNSLMHVCKNLVQCPIKDQVSFGIYLWKCSFLSALAPWLELQVTRVPRYRLRLRPSQKTLGFAHRPVAISCPDQKAVYLSSANHVNTSFSQDKEGGRYPARQGQFLDPCVAFHLQP